MDAVGSEQDEARVARGYWAAQGRTPFYEAWQHWRRFIAQRVGIFTPSSVLEFGCNAGRNLVEVRRLLPDTKLVGVDVNEESVAFGVESHGLDLRVAGEEYLATLDDASFDVVFTISVLDHMPNAQPVFVELARVARQALILLEPYTGRVQRVDGDLGEEALTRIRFTYSWNYIEWHTLVGGSWQWNWLPYPLSAENMGPYYWLVEGHRIIDGEEHRARP